jgi:molybdate transport system substrate-binding protein
MSLRALSSTSRRAFIETLALVVFAILSASPSFAGEWEGRSIQVFAGSAVKPALDEIAREFEVETGARVYLHYGGSGAVLSQLLLARRGDIYLPGSSDFMEKAKRKEVVEPDTEVRLAYLIPAINVAKGNPKEIRSLDDLAKGGVRVGVARPDAVCVGLYAVETLTARELGEAVRPNIVNFAESCRKTAQMLSLGLVDAVLGWAVFGRWEPERIETIFLKPQEVRRIGYIPAALSSFAEEREVAEGFLRYLTKPVAKAILHEKGYFVELEEARAHTAPDTPVGGEFPLPKGWD